MKLPKWLVKDYETEAEYWKLQSESMNKSAEYWHSRATKAEQILRENNLPAPPPPIGTFTGTISPIITKSK